MRLLGAKPEAGQQVSLLGGGPLETAVFILGGLVAVFLGIILLFGLLSGTRFTFLARLTLAGIFLFAAVPKILDPVGFAMDISNYQVLPQFLVNVTAIVLPWIEAFAALALLSGFAMDGAILLITIQLVAFIGMLAQAWFRDLDIDCGCFGHGKGGRSVAKALMEDWVFLAVAASIMLTRLRCATRSDAATA
jgi:putative oxidoreductase